MATTAIGTGGDVREPDGAGDPGVYGPWPAGVGSRAAAAQRATLAFALVLTIFLLAFLCARYLAFDGYADHIDPNMAIAAWEYVQGTPIYQLQDGAPVFANLYGPLAFLAEVPALVVFGPGVLASKLTGVAALLITLALLAAKFLRGPRPRAIDALLFVTLAMLALSPWSFWARGDPIETLLVAIAVVTAASPIVVGGCIGLAVNIKIHAFLYFFPIVLELWLRRGWRSLVPLAAAAAAAVMWPFLLPGVSLHDYAVTLGQQLAGRGHTVSEGAKVLAYFALLALPVAMPLATKDEGTEARRYGLAGLATLALLLYPATFPGAGPRHFLPLLPVLADARRRLPAGRLGAAPLLAVLVIAVSVAASSLHWMAARGGWGALADEAAALVADSPVKPAAIGYGESEPNYEVAQLARAKLAFRGVPPVVDAQILMELGEAGIDGSRRWLPLVSECKVARWILPKGERPFALGSYYPGVAPFDEDFRKAFSANYRIAAESRHFAIWQCRDHAPGRGDGPAE